MATVTIDVDFPPGVTITAYERHGDGHGFEVSWPWPTRCRCDSCRKEDDAHLEVKDSVQVVRDLDIWGQPSFWIYPTAFHRCPWCHHRQHLIPPFKRKDKVAVHRELPKVQQAYRGYLRQQRDAHGVGMVRPTAEQQGVEKVFPAIAQWVRGYGHVEVGDQEMFGFVARALGYGGLAFEDDRPDTLAEALASLERGLAGYFEREGIELEG
jgi:hypothetical protein